MDRSRIAVFILEHDAFKTVQDALASIGDGGGMVPKPGTFTEGFYAIDIQRVSQEGGKHAHGIAAAAHAGADGVRQKSRHFQELFPGFHADAHLEIAHHLRIWMWPSRSSNDVKCIMWIGNPIAQCLIHRIF